MSGTQEDPGQTVRGKVEVHDNWYVVADVEKRHAVMIGVWLPPPDLPGVVYSKIDPSEARAVLSDLLMRTLTDEVRSYVSVRVAHNNRLLAIGPWHPPQGIAGIQVDALQADQARELIGELAKRSTGPSLVGTMEIKG